MDDEKKEEVKGDGASQGTVSQKQQLDKESSEVAETESTKEETGGLTDKMEGGMKKRKKTGVKAKSGSKVEHKKTPPPEEELMEDISVKGADVLHTVEKGLQVGVKAITSGVKIAGKFTGRFAHGARSKVQFLRLRHRIKNLYVEIGAEVCRPEFEGKKEIDLDKSGIKKLIKQVYDIEAKIKEIER